jgi:hypothetical protein
MKKYIIACVMLFPIQGLADNTGIGLSLPGAGSSYGSDSIRAGDIDCKNSIGGATTFEFGVTGIIDNYASPFGSPDYGNSEKDVGVYARIVIPLDKPKERINCNSLYQIELRKKRLEVLKLQQELEALRRLNESSTAQFEN